MILSTISDASPTATSIPLLVLTETVGAHLATPRNALESLTRRPVPRGDDREAISNMNCIFAMSETLQKGAGGGAWFLAPVRGGEQWRPYSPTPGLCTCTPPKGNE